MSVVLCIYRKIKQCKICSIPTSTLKKSSILTFSAIFCNSFYYLTDCVTLILLQLFFGYTLKAAPFFLHNWIVITWFQNRWLCCYWWPFPIFTAAKWFTFLSPFRLTNDIVIVEKWSCNLKSYLASSCVQSLFPDYFNTVCLALKALHVQEERDRLRLEFNELEERVNPNFLFFPSLSSIHGVWCVL